MSTTKSVRRDQMRTSSLALALQVSAAAIKIIPVATAVFAFQFLGCPHQPPGEQNKVHGGALASQPMWIHVVKRERTCWAPDFFWKRILPSASLETLSTELLVYRNTSHTIVMVERSKRSFVYHLRSAICYKERCTVVHIAGYVLYTLTQPRDVDQEVDPLFILKTASIMVTLLSGTVKGPGVRVPTPQRLY